MQLAIRDPCVQPGIVGLPDNRGLIRLLRQVPIDAVGRDVQCAVGEPADVQVVGVEGHVTYLGVGRDPVQPLALLAPERVRVRDRLPVHFAVLLRVARVAVGEVLRDRYDILLVVMML
jgi:hypothetical protein